MIRIINRINIAFGENLCNSKAQTINGILTKCIYIFFLKSICFLLIVRLGSIPELPAKSCKEIKASEGEWAVNGNYWIHFLEIEKILLAHCDMKKEGK